MPKQTKANNLNYFIDPTFNKVNRLFVLLFENEDDKKYFSKYYTPEIEIKDFNVLVDGKGFFDVPVRNKEETSQKLLTWVKIMIIQLASYWIMNIFQSTLK